MSMNNHIGDELANKVRYLHKALIQAENIISVLEEENKKLADALNNLASKNKESYTDTDDIWFEPTY